MTSLNLAGLLPLIERAPGYGQLIERLKAGAESRESLGLLGAVRPTLTAALHRDLARATLLITAHPERARQLHDQLRAFSPHPEAILLFPAPEALPYERVPWDVETARQRMDVLAALVDPASRTPHPLIVTSARALLQKTIGPAEFRDGVRTLRAGDRVAMKELLRLLYTLGYEPTSVVEAPGTSSHRGGIVDVFPPASPRPVRVELFGDEVESLRLFDPATQRSEEKVPSITLTPAREALPVRGPEVASALSELDLSTLHPLAEGEVKRQLEALAEGQAFRGIEFYLPYLHPQPATLLDYLPPEGLLIVDDWMELESAAIELEGQAASLLEDLIKAGELPADFDAVPHVTWGEFRPGLAARPFLVLGYDQRGLGRHPLSKSFTASPRYGGQLKEAVVDCLEMMEHGQAVVIVSRQAERLSALFEEWGLYLSPVEGLTEPPESGGLVLVKGALAEGWRLESGSICDLLTDGEIFGWRMPRPRPAPRRRTTSPEAFFANLTPGDHVVHIEHGIGLFQGLVKMEIGGVDREYLDIEYAEGDKLYVPTYQVDRVGRYVGVGDRPPTITRLGSTDWERVKARAKRAVEHIAKELLELYSVREVIPGHAYSPDTPWQRELELSFPYVETEDQQRAIDEVKADMEQGKPMDRLIAGDVGYGKTEVALRAAFKAVMDGKQVAVLVPTTVLAQQHYVTFQERLAAFPIEVEMLSRFRTRSEQRKILERLREGTLDIVIGTHRLIQKDVTFKDLGLLIIDEEHRFGVRHKERLKQLRKEVDVLTLTATPIPRTLHMSLTGVRDMTTIETPPEERLPIVTHVAEYDEGLIRQAIRRELNRGGQVFFVHNRVIGITLVAQRLQRLVPDARVAVAHGQMEEIELAQVMLDFAAGRVDILVCTSIIESGLDIPNANTLIVDRADRFGLAQLYQLRGRVGREARQAYAYFLYGRHQELSEDARKRLQTIMEASELGAGFRIAMRDLEIRGAGDILGARQHGHIAAVGFDLYCRLLAQAIKELKVDGPKSKVQSPKTMDIGPLPTIDLPLNAYLPQEYVAESDLRLRLYRRMTVLTTRQEVEEMARELEDRFGPRPKPVENLLYLLRLKLLAAQAGVRTIARERKGIVLKLEVGNWKLEVGKGVHHPISKLGRQVRVEEHQVWFPVRGGERAWREVLQRLLEVLAEEQGTRNEG